MKKCAIIIPFYRSQLTSWERTSYLRTTEALYEYDIFAIQPERQSYYEDQNFKSSGVEVKAFPARYFDSIDGYNKLMLSKLFYQSFQRYEYILIVQLDALILHGRLDLFLDQKWDYYGAPWVGFDIRSNKSLIPYLPWHRRISWINKVVLRLGFWCVGNGGVSLRRVSKFLSVLELNEKFGRYDLDELPINEDNFWSFCANRIDNQFQVAPFSEALKFAFETNPRMSFELNDCQMPFACHAFEKHDFEFWNRSFNALGIRNSM